MKYILIPDSFKGNLSSAEICDIMERAITEFDPAAEIVKIPVADGGEGSVDCFLAAMGGEKVSLTVSNPYDEPIRAFYGLVENGKTAVIEMAAAAGLPLVGERRHAEQTTTYGVGQLMADAVQRGCRRLIVGLGGSATNDLGTGAAAALGVRFYDDNDRSFIPVGGTLSHIARMDMSGLLPGLRDIEIIVMCDIDNPLYGENGAAYIFAPQKGADPAMVEFLDHQLRAGAERIRRELGVDIAGRPGAGAAGGMGGGMAAFLGAELRPGIETVLDTVGFDRLLDGADMVFSGEGKLDRQSLRGKVVIGTARRTKAAGIPLIAVVGDIGDNIDEAYDQGVTAIFSINRVAVDFAKARERSRSDLLLTMRDLLRVMNRPQRNIF